MTSALPASIREASSSASARASPPPSSPPSTTIDRFAFLGFYIVRPELRGRGFGLRLWQAGLAHAGSRAVGLDGVVAQQDNYRKSGFKLAYRSIRYGGVPTRPGRGGRDRASVRAAVRNDCGGGCARLSGGAPRVLARLARSAGPSRRGTHARRQPRRVGGNPALPQGPQDRAACRSRPQGGSNGPCRAGGRRAGRSVHRRARAQ